MVELIINGRYVDLKIPNVKYVKQVNDLADVTTVNTSYSYSLTVPKTPNNTKIFKGLGIVGDTSRIPYTKNLTQLIDNGAMIISHGVSTVRETSIDYKVVVQDGIIDFFRSIENRTIGVDLDLSELSHTKNATNIVASFTNPNYRYLISEYNGWTVRDGTLNPDYQVPSINQKYIFDKIMHYSGYTYEGLPDISGEWTTFPTPPTIPTDEEILRFQGNAEKTQNITPYADWRDEFDPNWTSITVHDTDFLTLVNNWDLKILQTANYKSEFFVSGKMLYGVFVGNQLNTWELPIKMTLYNNGQEISSAYSAGDAVINYFNGGAANTLRFFPQTLTSQEAQDRGFDDQLLLDALDSGDFYIFKVTLVNLNAKFSTMGVEVFDFGEAFRDYSMTDFIKEIMFRKSLTPFPDVDDKHIKFMTLSDRIDVSNAIDWSKKYVSRNKEAYAFGSYAKQNSLLMKHDNSEDSFGNGILEVNNDNLNDTYTLFQSNYFAPSGNLKRISSIPTELFYEMKFWEREVKDDDGVQTIEYKPLSNRFFLLREQNVTRTIDIGGIIVTSFPKATMQGTSMNDVVNEYYVDWWRIFDDLRIHDIELMINQHDIATVRMDVPYYFEQEGAYYILNRLPYESGKTVIGEFLKIKV